MWIPPTCSSIALFVSFTRTPQTFFRRSPVVLSPVSRSREKLRALVYLLHPCYSCCGTRVTRINLYDGGRGQTSLFFLPPFPFGSTAIPILQQLPPFPLPDSPIQRPFSFTSPISSLLPAAPSMSLKYVRVGYGLGPPPLRRPTNGLMDPFGKHTPNPQLPFGTA